MIYSTGRTLQLLALLLLPSAIWVAEAMRDERGAITIFLGSAVLFFIGWIFTQKGSKE